MPADKQNQSTVIPNQGTRTPGVLNEVQKLQRLHQELAHNRMVSPVMLTGLKGLSPRFQLLGFTIARRRQIAIKKTDVGQNNQQIGQQGDIQEQAALTKSFLEVNQLTQERNSPLAQELSLFAQQPTITQQELDRVANQIPATVPLRFGSLPVEIQTQLSSQLSGIITANRVLNETETTLAIKLSIEKLTHLQTIPESVARQNHADLAEEHLNQMQQTAIMANWLANKPPELTELQQHPYFYNQLSAAQKTDYRENSNTLNRRAILASLATAHQKTVQDKLAALPVGGILSAANTPLSLKNPATPNQQPSKKSPVKLPSKSKIPLERTNSSAERATIPRIFQPSVAQTEPETEEAETEETTYTEQASKQALIGAGAAAGATAIGAGGFGLLAAHHVATSTALPLIKMIAHLFS